MFDPSLSRNGSVMRVHIVKYNLKSVVAKIARFKFEEVPRVETETAIYQIIDGHDIGPSFLGHLIERIEGRPGGIADLGACQAVVERLHSLGVVHRDLNRYNFVISPSGVILIDFENAMKSGDKEAMQKEFVQLAEQLF
jgi:tRNA A-37 threonylcarbamoyl transferase component Bud32